MRIVSSHELTAFWFLEGERDRVAQDATLFLRAELDAFLQSQHWENVRFEINEDYDPAKLKPTGQPGFLWLSDTIASLKARYLENFDDSTTDNKDPLTRGNPFPALHCNLFAGVGADRVLVGSIEVLIASDYVVIQKFNVREDDTNSGFWPVSLFPRDDGKTKDVLFRAKAILISSRKAGTPPPEAEWAFSEIHFPQSSDPFACAIWEKEQSIQARILITPPAEVAKDRSLAFGRHLENTGICRHLSLLLVSQAKMADYERKGKECARALLKDLSPGNSPFRARKKVESVKSDLATFKSLRAHYEVNAAQFASVTQELGAAEVAWLKSWIIRQNIALLNLKSDYAKIKDRLVKCQVDLEHRSHPWWLGLFVPALLVFVGFALTPAFARNASLIIALASFAYLTYWEFRRPVMTWMAILIALSASVAAYFATPVLQVVAAPGPREHYKHAIAVVSHIRTHRKQFEADAFRPGAEARQDFKDIFRANLQSEINDVVKELQQDGTEMEAIANQLRQVKVPDDALALAVNLEAISNPYDRSWRWMVPLLVAALAVILLLRLWLRERNASR